MRLSLKISSVATVVVAMHERLELATGRTPVDFDPTDPSRAQVDCDSGGGTLGTAITV